MARVEIDNLSKYFKIAPRGEVRGVKNLTLTLEKSQLLVILGPSGCGKTTLLRLIAGLDHPTSGTIRIDGQVVNDLAPEKRGVSMVFQNPGLYPHLTVLENLEFGLKLRKEQDTSGRARRTAELLGLIECSHRFPHELSGGQKQRVALGRSMVLDPKIFLLDEPLSNLDPPTRLQLRREILRWHSQVKATTIHVTHDQTEAMSLAGELAIMNEGAIVQVGRPQEVYRQPANLFTAQFLGSPAMPVFECTFVPGHRHIIVNDAGPANLRLPLPPGLLPPAYAGSKVIAGLRPEDVGISSHSRGDELEMTVEEVERTGAEAWAQLRLHSLVLKVRLEPDTDLKPGDNVMASLNLARLHLFDPDTGLRLSV